MPQNIIEYKIIYPSRYASSVRLVGDFGSWSGWVDMKQEAHGYTSSLFVPAGATIKYKFFVDGKHWGFDPTRHSTTDEEGHVVNVETVSHNSSAASLHPTDSEESLSQEGGESVSGHSEIIDHFGQSEIIDHFY